MQTEVSPIWRRLPSDLADRMERCISIASERRGQNNSGHIFFRADDVAAPGEKFAKLMEIFKRHRVPLCLAVVPAWLTGSRWQYLKGLAAKESSLWCWHQHGWRHVNHEIHGKKQEFGDFRSRSSIKRDLVQGKRRLEDLMAADFYPVFTPPWNRCNLSTLHLLKELGYAAVSRNCGSRPEAPREFSDLCVNVDLHTRKERDPALGWKNLLNELRQAIASDHCGIMIHHQRMNAAAFDFLEVLLKAMVGHQDLQLLHFKHLNRLGA